MPFTATWMDPEVIMLSEVSQRKTHIIWYHLHWNLKKEHKWTYLQKRNKVTDVENKHGYQKGKEVWAELGDWDWHIHTTIYKIDT